MVIHQRTSSGQDFRGQEAVKTSRIRAAVLNKLRGPEHANAKLDIEIPRNLRRVHGTTLALQSQIGVMRTIFLMLSG